MSGSGSRPAGTTPALAAGLLAGAALLSGCTPPHPHAAAPLRSVSALDCPDTQGDLTRKSAADDGKSCVYATEAGDQVTLQLVSLAGGDARGALGPIEAQLKTEVPVAPPSSTVTSGGTDKDRVDIDLPGVHIHAKGDGHADVDAGGVRVAAEGGESDNASVQVGDGARGVTVNAGEGGAQVHINEGGSGVRLRYVLTSEAPGPHGYRVAGYEARGPLGGPIVVAALLSKSDDEDDLRHDIHALIRRNVGG